MHPLEYFVPEPRIELQLLTYLEYIVCAVNILLSASLSDCLRNF